MLYFLSDNGGAMTVDGDPELWPVIPDGYREVTEEEYGKATGVIVLDLPAAAGPRRS